MIPTKFLLNEYYDFMMDNDEMWIIYPSEMADFFGRSTASAMLILDLPVCDA